MKSVIKWAQEAGIKTTSKGLGKNELRLSKNSREVVICELDKTTPFTAEQVFDEARGYLDSGTDAHLIKTLVPSQVTGNKDFESSLYQIPLPESHPINTAALGVWKEAQCSKADKLLAGMIADALQHVSFEEFLETFRVALEKFKKQFASNQGTEQKYYLSLLSWET